jgi:transmembrane sensor
MLTGSRIVDSAGGPANHRAIEECAARWLARRDGDEWSAEDEARLTAWLNEATAHRVALLRLENVWDGARRARALSAFPPGVVPPASKWRRSPFFHPFGSVIARKSPRLRFSGWRTAAAGLMLMAALGTLAHIFHWFGPAGVYSTPVGVISSVPLPDGSGVTLNTASRIRVEFEPKARLVVLEKGEAYFAVKRNPARPFIVIAGDQRIVDLGTQFSVRRDPAGLRVIVTEGTVKLVAPRPSALDSIGSFPLSRLPLPVDIGVPLSAGTVATAHAGDLLVHKESIREAEAMVSWREGYLTFDDTTLATAVAEFNRYNVRQIVIEGQEVAGIRISGTFRPTDSEAFVRLLHEGYAIDVHQTGEKITLRKE